MFRTPDTGDTPTAARVQDYASVLRRVLFEIIDDETAGLPELGAMDARIMASAFDSTDATVGRVGHDYPSKTAQIRIRFFFCRRLTGARSGIAPIT